MSHKRTTTKKRKPALYLYVASVGRAQVCHRAAVHLYHVDGGDQGVCQLLVPVLQPLHKLGHLQAVLALFPFVDSLVWVAVIGRALPQRKQQSGGMRLFQSRTLAQE